MPLIMIIYINLIVREQWYIPFKTNPNFIYDISNFSIVLYLNLVETVAGLIPSFIFQVSEMDGVDFDHQSSGGVSHHILIVYFPLHI